MVYGAEASHARMGLVALAKAYHTASLIVKQRSRHKVLLFILLWNFHPITHENFTLTKLYHSTIISAITEM